MSVESRQKAQAISLLKERGIMRLTEFLDAGITATTVSRMAAAGDVLRLSRGLYQLPDAPLDINHNLAEAAKRVPAGVICLVSALAFHELTDQLPRVTWMAIGNKSWKPKEGTPPIRFVQFKDEFLVDSVVTVAIEGVPVKIFDIPKTIADCFRHRGSIGITVAIEGLQQALRQNKTPPAEIARAAKRGRIYSVMQPYLEALTANG